jgi:peptide/nickel transport system permease protein
VRRRLLRRALRDPLTATAAIVVALLVLTAIGADFIASDLPIAMRYQGRLYLFPNVGAPEDRPAELRALAPAELRRAATWSIPTPVGRGPADVDLAARLTPPGSEHALGTDALGRDVLARLVHGARVSLSIGVVAVGLYVLIGLLLGLTAGYLGGGTDAAISRLIEITMVFPTFFLVLAVLGVVERPSIFHVMAVIGLTGWPGVARLARGEALRVRTLDYVVASRALGGGTGRLLARHVLPNAISPVLVAATFGVASAILLESALSFLGFGTPPPTASWGELLTEAYEHAVSSGAWWLAVFPGLALFATVTSWNLLAEGLRDAMDPRLNRE